MATIGKYEIVEELGRGGMGVVYRAYDPVMEREVAIKVVSDVMVAKPEMRERFLREARTAGKLSHENITIVHDVGEDAGKPFIVMEYLKGDDLGHMIESKSPMTLRDKLTVAIQICRGLAFLHTQGLVHRDIKPANIRVVGGKVKIMDFGIARSTTSELTKSGAIIGTPYYMSPEQIRGLKVDHRSDIFSFGVLLYELLSGTKPFTGDETTTVMYKIVHEEPPWSGATMISGQSPLHDILAKLLAKEPERRYRDLLETARDLEKVLAGAPAGAADVSTVFAGASTATVKIAPKPRAQAPPSQSGNRRMIWYIAGAAVALAIVAAVLYRLTAGNPPAQQKGTVALNILPWAEVLKVVDADRHEIPLRKKTYTPCSLDLPEGSYEIQLINPELASSMSLSVQVVAGQTQQIMQKIDSVDYQDILTMIQAPDSTAK